MVSRCISKSLSVKKISANNPIDTATQPWISSPYSLFTWWDMEQFSAEQFYEIGKYLGMLGELISLNQSREKYDKMADREFLTSQFDWILRGCVKLELKVSGNTAEDILRMINDEDFTIGSVRELLQELANTIRREMQSVLFLHVPYSRSEFYEKPEWFGPAVSARFPNLQEDMVEACDCLALSRGTACVFHLMRIMEAAVQEFGRVLGIGSVETTNWQIILDQINKAIKSLPSKGHITAALSEAAANLYSVKLAWRNEVMHPKATYTEKEAEDVLRQVRLFMQTLAERLPAPAPTSSTIM